MRGTRSQKQSDDVDSRAEDILIMCIDGVMPKGPCMSLPEPCVKKGLVWLAAEKLSRGSFLTSLGAVPRKHLRHPEWKGRV